LGGDDIRNHFFVETNKGVPAKGFRSAGLRIVNETGRLAAPHSSEVRPCPAAIKGKTRDGESIFR